ncbi:MAG: GGDEF domain-containing protein [Solobacterium sp.]|nr:GGDEF domain-containing protein [Solobacterium sp.]
MYTREKLSEYSYFKRVLEGRRISDLLDPLTGLITRSHIIGFVQSLIEEGRPFTFGIIDLDNFKYINDTYGHTAGDGILTSLSKELISYLSDYGVAGRFGGDEFLFVNLRDQEYADKKAFCHGMYFNNTVLRRTYNLGAVELFVTATTGLATYPINATTYEELFLMVDKALYRGKSKGRNCYIIYLPEKHKDIEIKRLKRNSIYTIFRNFIEHFDSARNLNEKLTSVYEGLKEDLNITNMYFANEHQVMKSVLDHQVVGTLSDISNLMKEPVYSTNNLEDIREISPVLYSVFRDHEVESFIIAKVGAESQNLGYLICAEPHTLRIWQEEEYAIMFSMARLFAGYMLRSGEQFD